MARFGVIIFPGSNCDQDAVHVCRDVLSCETHEIWHADTELPDIDCIVVPGGFSYGDYLRAGAISSFAHIMPGVKKYAENGGLVIGICNGFQILTEAGLLPGALLRNTDLNFHCHWTDLMVQECDSPFLSACQPGEILKIPIAHNEGNFRISPEGLTELKAYNQIAFKYVDERGEPTEAANPNGAIENIAGIVNAKGNVLGMMPHPERCSEEELGSSDGIKIFEGVLKTVDSVKA